MYHGTGGGTAHTFGCGRCIVTLKQSQIRFDAETYEAVVTLRIEKAYNSIPDDTFAKIYTAGLLGEQYVGLDPGGNEKYLSQGDQITHTQSSLVLEDIIGQFLFSKAEEGVGDAKGE